LLRNTLCCCVHETLTHVFWFCGDIVRV
jgi:hypothetical protein